MVQDQRQAIPLDIVRLKSATRAYTECLRAALPAVISLGESGDFLRDQIRDSERETEPGTPAAIAMAIADILDGEL